MRLTASGRSLSVVTAASGDQVERDWLVSTGAPRISSGLVHEGGVDGHWMIPIAAVVAKWRL